MNIQEAVEKLRKDQKVKWVQLGSRLGLSTNAIVQRIKNQKNLSMDVAIETLKALDYEVVIQPIGSHKPEDRIVLTKKEQ